MTVLMYLVELTSTGSVGERVTPAGPVHSVFTVTGTSTDGLNSTVQVRVTEPPGGMTPVGLLVILRIGVGTREEKCNVNELKVHDYMYMEFIHVDSQCIWTLDNNYSL